MCSTRAFIQPISELLTTHFSNNWSPVLNISKLMISFMSFLSDPNPDHALVPERAKLLKSNKDEYLKTAKEWTEKYAM